MKQKAKWIFIYWMPYDNNLSGNKGIIEKMLTYGSKGADIIIFLFSDDYENKRIQRKGISDGNVFENIELISEDSSNTAFFGKCILELHERYEDERWGLSFLGHAIRRICIIATLLFKPPRLKY